LELTRIKNLYGLIHIWLVTWLRYCGRCLAVPLEGRAVGPGY